MNPQNNRRILVIDDNRAIHEDFRKILCDAVAQAELDEAEAKLLGSTPTLAQGANEVFEVESAYQGEQGLGMVRASVAAEKPYALAFVDMRMPPGWDGVETIAKIWETDPEIQIVICTAYSDYSREEILHKLQFVDRFLILKKPFDTIEVCQLAGALTEKWQMTRRLDQMRKIIEERTKTLEAEVVEHRRSEEELRQSQARYALAVAGANDGIWDWDLDKDEIFYSPRWKSMLGETEAAITSSPSEWFKRIHPEDLHRMKHDMEQHIQGRSAQFRSEYRMMRSDGEYRWMLSRGVVVRDANGKVLRAAGSQTDITDHKLAESQLRHDAMHDALTGLANRAVLIDRINQCLHRVQRAPEQLFAVIFMDLDRFKVINDSLGHVAGDQLLIELSRRLGALLRANDMVSRGEPHHLARLGGDEFVVVLDNICNPVDALRVADRLEKAMAQAFDIGGHEVVVSASFGVAVSNEKYLNAEEILRDADTALYDAKNSGRGGYRLFDPQMHASAMQRLVMEAELRRAIEREELRLLYQPVQWVRTGRLAEVEALVRWEHPQRGLISPADFIPLAEETGLILPLGLWVLRNACNQLKRWQTQIPVLRNLSVAVNVSARQFLRTEMLAEVAGALAESGLGARYLNLEITETTIMETDAPALDELNALNRMGVQFHLDDFGTGYSSLGHLHRMPIKTLKIDRSFIASGRNGRTGTSIVQAIIALARSLEMQVIAEGVETKSQFEFLRDLGCDFAQGYYFAPPLTAEKLVEFAAATAASTPLAAIVAA